MDDLTDDGYQIIPARPPRPEGPKGFQCGKCGLRAKWNEPLGYVCPHTDCPVFYKVTCQVPA